MNRLKFTEQDFLEAIASSSSHKEAKKKLGYTIKTNISGMSKKDRYSTLYNKLKPDISHFNLTSLSGLQGTSIETKTVVYFNACKQDCERRKPKRSFNIPFELFKELIFQPCYYCGKIDRVDESGFIYYANGIDRLDNDIGYEPDNCVPACKKCNFSKHTRLEEDFIKHAYDIVTFQESNNVRCSHHHNPIIHDIFTFHIPI